MLVPEDAADDRSEDDDGAPGHLPDRRRDPQHPHGHQEGRLATAAEEKKKKKEEKKREKEARKNARDFLQGNARRQLFANQQLT